MSQYTRLPGVSLTPSGTQDVNLKQVNGSAISEGQKTMAASLPVVVASDQSTLPVSAASLPLPSGAATSALQTTGNTSVASIDTKTPALGQALAASSVPVVLPATQITTLTPPTSVGLNSGANLVGKVGIDQTTVGTTNAVSLAQLGTGTINTGNGTAGTGTLRVAIASDTTSNTNAFLTAEQKSATSALSNVVSSATTVTVLASNASRKGAMVFNDSTATLYLKFGATASTTSYTVQIAPNGYYEFPANPALYTGICDGIWSSANGNARVTELS